MADIPPTTSIEMDATDQSPCCDAPLVLVSPPHGYECRECYEEYDTSGPDTCQTVKQDGEICGRDLPCPYHG